MFFIFLLQLVGESLFEIDAFGPGILSFGPFQKMAVFQILFLWLFSFLKFNTPDREMEVGPAINIKEVFPYLMALSPGKDLGTSLILSLLAPFWSLGKLYVNIFECKEIL